MSASAHDVVAALLPKLRSQQVTFFPIRHHSPACAIHLQRWIMHHRPKAVLVEGPGSFTRRIDFLLDEGCQCPVAFYTTFVDVKGRLSANDAANDEERIPGFGPPRFAAYYPLCDYSPELVALRTGGAVGARLRFVDLEYGEMILAQHQPDSEPSRDSIRVDSLADDAHLKHSEYIQALAKKLRCRDFNDLWDHLFESSWEDVSTDVFIDRVATYCAMARLDYSDERLRRDGTLARESCMAAAIVEEMEKGGHVLVVTGGFHTVVLPDLVAQKQPRPEPIEFSEPEGGNWLMRYSFDQLDALAGYSAGMPSPAFYNRCWHVAQGLSASNGTKAALERLAADIVIEIGRLTRERQLPELVTTPDTIAAVQMTKQLATLRGHPWPLREDILDGIRSCFIKGELTVEGQMLLRLVREVLAGNQVGQLPPGGDLPPIVADFHQEARRFRLPVDRVEKKKCALDLYREASHRELSRFLHRLDLLGAPFGQFTGGPDFVTGQGIDLMQEHWEVGWSPMVESALIEAAVFGPTIAEAAAAKLQQQIAALEEEGKGRSADAAVTVLIRACRLGLHVQAAALVPVIDVHIAEDPALLSVAQGLSQLDLLREAREPLEAAQLSALPKLSEAAYQRACRLLHDVAGCPDDAVDGVIRALQIVREVVASRAQPRSENVPEGKQPPLDADLFFGGLRAVVEGPPQKAQAAVVGAAAGILYGEGRFSEQELVRTILGFLGGTASEPRKIAGILRGLLSAAREIAWQVTDIIRAIDSQFEAWDDNAFMNLLPELRLAFTSLTPREVARVADHLSAFHEGKSLGEIVHMDLDEQEVHLALAVDKQVRESLQADGLLA